MSGVKEDAYSAEILRVDLSEGKLSREPVDPTILRSSIGGCALGASYLYREVPIQAEWQDPENRLMVFAGLLSGTALPGSGGITVSAKGAMTGGAASTQAQGVFGAYLRMCGLLGVLFQGRSQSWSYLLVDEEGNAQIRSAEHLLGKDTWETADAIAAELGKRERDLSVLSIGPAGEKLVRWSAMISDKGHAAAHNGVGAVMGSKRLKAIVVMRGKRAIPIGDKGTVAGVAKALLQPVIANPGSIHYFGTLNGIQKNYAIGNLPIKNYSTCVWEVPEETINKFSGPYIREHYSPKHSRPCWACPNHHCEVMTIPDGPHAGMEVEEPEYEQFSGLGPNLGIDDVSTVMVLSNLGDRLGLDVNETGWMLSCVMECFERGILTTSDTDGLEMRWGNAEAAMAMMKRIAGREGIGDILAEGVMRAVQRIGRGAEEIGIYTMKGATPRGHDHRARWTEMFDTCVSESGALENTPIGPDLTLFGFPAKYDAFDPDLLARMEAQMKGAMQFEDSLVTCRFNSQMNLKLLTEALSAVTGWDFGFDEAMAVGRRAINLMRVYNLRCGISGAMDRPSRRYSSTPTNGPAEGKGIAPHFDGMLKEYYRLMGWDEQGRPLPETLKALGLEMAAQDLWA